jgi:prepilin-type N-terminal cleavage/methylation domain-containing protein
VRARAATEEGFTLVEVIIALVLMSVVMSSIAVFFVGSVRHGAGLQRRQAAVAVAGQALEAARAVSALPDSAGCVKLLQGRTQSLVDAQWASAPSTVDLSTTAKGVMPASCGSTAIVPLTGVARAMGTVVDPIVLNGLPYTVRTFIGTCKLTGSTGGCTTSGTGSTLYRIVVAVTWTGAGCAGTCQYTTSSLVDPSSDPVYNVRSASAPVAVADSLCFTRNTPAAFNIIANDTGALGNAPVTVVSTPTKGTLGSTVTSGVASYTPITNANGGDSFTYKLTDVNGVVSSVVTASITIKNGSCP